MKRILHVLTCSVFVFLCCMLVRTPTLAAQWDDNGVLHPFNPGGYPSSGSNKASGNLNDFFALCDYVKEHGTENGTEKYVFTEEDETYVYTLTADGRFTLAMNAREKESNWEANLSVGQGFDIPYYAYVTDNAGHSGNVRVRPETVGRGSRLYVEDYSGDGAYEEVMNEKLNDLLSRAMFFAAEKLYEIKGGYADLSLEALGFTKLDYGIEAMYWSALVTDHQPYQMKYYLEPIWLVEKYPITWSFYNEDTGMPDNSVVSVNETGLLSYLQPGKVLMVTRIGPFSTQTYVDSIKAKVSTQSVKVNNSLIQLDVGESRQIDYTVTPADSTDEMRFASLNEEIATVSSDGVVKGVKKGSTTIRVYSGSKSASALVYVGDMAAPSDNEAFNYLTTQAWLGSGGSLYVKENIRSKGNEKYGVKFDTRDYSLTLYYTGPGSEMSVKILPDLDKPYEAAFTYTVNGSTATGTFAINPEEVSESAVVSFSTYEGNENLRSRMPGLAIEKLCRDILMNETFFEGTKYSMTDLGFTGLGLAGTNLIHHEAVAATCTEPGSMEYWTDKDGKLYADAEAEREITEAELAVKALGHAFGDWVVIKEAAPGVAGLERRTCSHDASHTEEREIPALPLPPDPPVVTNPFVDVKEGAFYYDAVLWAKENNITGGTDATHFSPLSDCTRAQVVTFLWRAAGSPDPKTIKNPFTDVETGKYYYKAVLWALENGITNGLTATTFGPNASCTRGQVVTFLHRAKGSPADYADVSKFTDVAAGKFYYNAVRWAVKAGVTSGTSATAFSPNASCTRGQIVTFLYRAYK